MLLIPKVARAGVPNLSGCDRGFSLPNQLVHRLIPVRCITLSSSARATSLVVVRVVVATLSILPSTLNDIRKYLQILWENLCYLTVKNEHLRIFGVPG